jgi:hypothetical protein
MPFVSDSFDADNFPGGMLTRTWEARAKATASGRPEPEYVRLWPHSAENAAGRADERTFLTGEAAWEFISGALERSNAAGTPWENKLTLQSFYYLSRTEPADFIRGGARLAAPRRTNPRGDQAGLLLKANQRSPANRARSRPRPSAMSRRT